MKMLSTAGICSQLFPESPGLRAGLFIFILFIFFGCAKGGSGPAASAADPSSPSDPSSSPTCIFYCMPLGGDYSLSHAAAGCQAPVITEVEIGHANGDTSALDGTIVVNGTAPYSFTMYDFSTDGTTEVIYIPQVNLYVQANNVANGSVISTPSISAGPTQDCMSEYGN